MAHIIVHVADGVDVDQGTHTRNHQHHHHGESIHSESPAHGQAADSDPVRERHGDALGMTGQGRSQNDRDHKGQTGSQAGNSAAEDFAKFSTEQQVDAQPDQRQKDHPGYKIESQTRFHRRLHQPFRLFI